MTKTTSNGISVGDRVQQIGKARRYPMKVTRVSPGGCRCITVGGGRIHTIAADRLRKVEQ